MNLLEPKEISLKDKNGIERFYTLHKLPYYEAREIGLQYIPSIIPKVGDYRTNEKMSQKLMSFVTVDINGVKTRLTTPDLVNNHVPDLETGLKLEFLEMDHNTSFFSSGTAYSFWEDAVQNLIAKILKTSTQSQEQSSTQEKPLSMS